MAITEEELKKLIEPRIDVEEISSISSDGFNLLTRIPKKIVERENIKKGQNIKWTIDNDSKKLKIELIEDGHTKKEKTN